MYALLTITLSMILGLALHDCRYLIIDSSPSQADMCNGVWPSFWNTENIRFEKFTEDIPREGFFQKYAEGEEGEPTLHVYISSKSHTPVILKKCWSVRETQTFSLWIHHRYLWIYLITNNTERNKIFENKSTFFCEKKNLKENPWD